MGEECRRESRVLAMCLSVAESSEVPTELDGCELRDWQMVPGCSFMMSLPPLS